MYPFFYNFYSKDNFLEKKPGSHNSKVRLPDQGNNMFREYRAVYAVLSISPLIFLTSPVLTTTLLILFFLINSLVVSKYFLGLMPFPIGPDKIILLLICFYLNFIKFGLSKKNVSIIKLNLEIFLNSEYLHLNDTKVRSTVVRKQMKSDES